jgi:hypothetical protein
MWLRKIMGLLDKVSKDTKKKDIVSLTKQDCEFLLLKLRSAQYTGDEFEQFYTVFKKITEIIEINK